MSKNLVYQNDIDALKKNMTLSYALSNLKKYKMLPYFFKSSFVNLPPKDHMEFAEFSDILFESATNIPLEQSFLPYKTPNSEYVLQSRLRAELRVTLNSLEQELIKHVITHKGIQKEVRMWCGYTLDEKKYLLYYAKISDLLHGFFTPKSIFDRDSKYTTLKSKLNGLLGVFQSLEVFNEYASFPNIFNVFCKDEDYDWEDDEDDNDEDEETAQIQKLENIYDTLIHALKETTSGDKLCSKIEERIPQPSTKEKLAISYIIIEEILKGFEWMTIIYAEEISKKLLDPTGS